MCSFQGATGILQSLKTIQLRERFRRQSLPLFRRSGVFECLPLAFPLPDPNPLEPGSTSGRLRPFGLRLLPRKEVIQPHLPIRLPCYDFTPVIGLTFEGWPLSVTSPASGAPNSHGVTGGVYKARERIHRGMLIRDY